MQRTDHLNLNQLEAPLAIVSGRGDLLGITPAGRALLQRLGVAADQALPEELKRLWIDTPIGRAGQWRPPTLTSAECLGFTPHRYGPDALVLFMREISDRQQQLSKQLHESSNEAVARLVSMTTAELRIALSTVFFNADVLCDETETLSSSDMRELLRGIRTGSEHLALTIDHLVDMARLGPPARAIFSLQRTLDRVERLLRSTIRDRQHRFDVRVGDEERWIIANPFRAQEILLSLAANAMEAADYPIELTIELATDIRTTPEALTLRVRDTGPGIPQTLRSHIFDPYFSTKEDHRGMGLTQARATARELGGDLVLEETTSGASFLLTLPSTEVHPGHHDDRAHR